MIRLNPFRFLGEKRCSSICPKKSTENSIQMVSAPAQIVKLVTKSYSCVWTFFEERTLFNSGVHFSQPTRRLWRNILEKTIMENKSLIILIQHPYPSIGKQKVFILRTLRKGRSDIK